MKYKIKQLLTHNYRSVKEVFTDVFIPVGFTIAQLTYSWKNRSHSDSFGIFTSQGDLIGFALVYEVACNPVNKYLSYIAVYKSYAGEKLGSRLLTHTVKKVLKHGYSLHLYPLQHAKLINWYRLHGFHAVANGYLNIHRHFTRYNTRYEYV
jgi:GNAT superfamily N-acetyltransferase